jgi:hypothetical protein
MEGDDECGLICAGFGSDGLDDISGVTASQELHGSTKTQSSSVATIDIDGNLQAILSR